MKHLARSKSTICRSTSDIFQCSHFLVRRRRKVCLHCCISLNASRPFLAAASYRVFSSSRIQSLYPELAQCTTCSIFVYTLFLSRKRYKHCVFGDDAFYNRRLVLVTHTMPAILKCLFLVCCSSWSIPINVN